MGVTLVAELYVVKVVASSHITDTEGLRLKIATFQSFSVFLKRNQREEDLRENHPMFDTPLFMVPRESKFRKACQLIVYARYDARPRDPFTGKDRKVKYKGLQ